MTDQLLHASFVLTSPGSLPLSASEVHVWAVPLHGDPEPFAAVLSHAERERSQRFRFADHQRRYQISHGALRRILGGYLGIEPAAVEFREGPRGKPYLAGEGSQADGPFFNMSHSGKLALIGFGSDELGLDVEKVRHLESLTQIARRHFADAEFAKLDKQRGDARELAFYRCWTRKEAYIKALGEGLSMALDSFEVSLGEQAEFVACLDGREDPSKWSMVDVSPGPEFVAALAMRAADKTVCSFRLEDC